MALDLRPLCAATPRHGFCCGDSEIDKWFRNTSLRDHEQRKHITTCVRFAADEPVAGFYALSTIAENARKLPDVQYYPFEGNLHFPCIQIVYLAMRQEHQEQGHGTGVLVHLIRRFAELGEMIGMPAMIVTPLNDRVRGLYTRMGFIPYPHGSRMVISLRAAIEHLAAVEAEIDSEQGNAQPAA